MSKEALIDVVHEELTSVLGRAVTIRDVTDWRATAVPLPGQITPIKGLRLIENGVICDLCTDPLTATSSPSRNFIDKHRSRDHTDRIMTGSTTHIGPIQTMSHAPSITRYFPAPRSANGSCGLKSGMEPSIEDGDDDDDDDDDDVAVILRKAKEDMLGSSSESEPDVLDRRAVLPFFLDTGIHDFLRQYDAHSLLSLWRIPTRRSKKIPRALSRLYTIVMETFFTDCDMASNMNPSIRRTIGNCDP